MIIILCMVTGTEKINVLVQLQIRYQHMEVFWSVYMDTCIHSRLTLCSRIGLNMCTTRLHAPCVFLSHYSSNRSSVFSMSAEEEPTTTEKL